MSLVLDTKRCPRCEKDLSVDDFYRHPTTKDRRHTYCKRCNIQTVRNSQLKRWYGLSPEQYDVLLSQRGVLCTNCNRGIGNFRDNPELLRSAIAYLGVEA